MSDAVIKTAGRVFEILGYFREAARPLSVREISEHFGYPTSSTSVLLKSISTQGYLVYDSELRAYFPSVRVAVLGDWIWESKFSHGTLVTLVEDFSKEVGETAILAVQNDIYAQYVHIVQSTNSIQFYAPVGTRRPLCMSGTGWAILTRVADDVILRHVSRANARGEAGRQFSGDEVLSGVSKARQLGYAFSRHTVTQGAGVIAMPFNVSGTAGRYAIAVAGVVDRLEEKKEAIVRTMSRWIDAYQASV